MNRETLQYINWLKGRQAQIIEAMTAGVPQNYEGYQRLIGQYESLTEALTTLEQLLRGDEEE